MDIGLDIETKGLNTNNFLIGCIIQDNRKKPKYFYTAENMYQYITKLIKKEAKYGHKVNLYAHNHLYDFTGYAKNHLTEIDEKNIIRIKKKTPILYVLHQTGYILDTQALFGKIPLSKLGEMIGLPKLKMPEELMEENKNWTHEEIKKLKPYVTRDAQICLTATKKLKNELQQIPKIGHRPKKCYTSSGISYNFFKQYCRTNIYCTQCKHTFTNEKGYGCPKCNAKLTKPYFTYFWNYYNKGNIYKTKNFKILSNAYRGARNECFQKGHFENTYSYDVNSMYPYCLTQMPIPDLKTEQTHKNATENMTEKELLQKIGVIKVTIKSPNNKIPYLPVRYKNCQIYPKNCEITGTYTTTEILNAKKEGYKIQQIHEGITYETIPFNPFRTYLNELYELRIKNKKTIGNTIKMLMNSLYGRWAMQITQEKEITVYGNQILEMQRQGYEIISEVGDKVLMIKKGEKTPSKNSHPIISLLTTANARNYLYQHLKKIPFHQLLYTDTDSIICIGDQSHLLKIGKKIGEWSIEHEKKSSYFAKEKNYMIGTKIVTAGIPRRHSTIKYLKGKQIAKVKQIFSHHQGLKTGNIQKIGTSQTINKVISELSKRDIIYPKKIIEQDKDQKPKELNNTRSLYT